MANIFLFVFAVICLHSTRAFLEFENPTNNVFDLELYQNVLDEELCEKQLSYIQMNNSMLMAEFLDAGLRPPRGILKGNFVDLGHYDQCIEISENFVPSNIEGKYCMINVPMTQNDFELPTLPEWPDEWPEWPEEWPEFPWPELLPNTRQHRNLMRNLQDVRAKMSKFSRLTGLDMDDIDMIRVSEGSPLAGGAFRLAVCVPKACTPRQFIDSILVNTSAVGLTFEEEFCRLKNDKPFYASDYAAMVVFAFIILLTAVCTAYDLYYTHILQGDPKKASTIGKAFSVYTNSRRLVTYNPVPGALECLDGVRSLAMMWVIVGHTYSSHLYAPFYNQIDFYTWMNSFSGLWIMVAPITVDTFFLLSGLLIVYTSVGKISRMGLIKNIHLFYLHRLLRMFPVLAAGVFLQATLFNHFTDGPRWNDVFAHKVHKCRKFWWSTLTHSQNLVTPENMCIAHSWYLAVDIQMHILSPLVLFWVLGKKRSAWIALSLSTAIVMVASTTYNAILGFQAAPVIPTRTLEDSRYYLKYYYVNTLSRCSPFFVGMLYGYLLSIFKGKKVHMPKWFVTLGWLCAFVVSALILYSTYPILQMDWDSPFWDNVINSCSRPGWAACVGWMIFACTHGYGGPINWFLSLRMWKLPSRMSFAMYIFHYPIIYAINATAMQPTEFSVIRYFYRFMADFSMALVVGFIVTVMIDSPFSTLIKLLMGGGPKRPRPEKLETREENGVNVANGINGVHGVNGNLGAFNPNISRDYDYEIHKSKL